MKYVLEPLLTVRKFREDAAANVLVAQRRKVAAAEADLERRRTELADYAAWRVRREEELWRSVLGKAVERQQLDDLKLDLQIVQAGHNERQERVFAAEKAVQEERAKLEQAVAAHREATRSREKLDLHKDLWRDGVKRDAEFAADLEMEDFKVRKSIVAA